MVDQKRVEQDMPVRSFEKKKSPQNGKETLITYVDSVLVNSSVLLKIRNDLRSLEL